MFMRILLPIDGTTGNDRAARAAFDLAGATGAGVVAVQVVPPPMTDQAYASIAMAGVPAPFDAAAMAVQPGDDGALETLRRRARKSGVRFHATQVVDANPVDAISNAARRTHCDVIVMCSRGFGRFFPSLSGDASGRVFRKSDVPMLLVHESEKGGVSCKRH